MNTSDGLSHSRRGLISIGVIVTLAIVIAFIILHNRKKTEIDPGFSKYIESYTTGIISKESSIRIRLAGEVQTSHEQNGELDAGVFDFSPSIKGKAYWVDERTIEFKPSEKLDPDKSYSADFKLSKLVNVPSQFDDFKFDFQTIKPDFNVTFAGLQTATNTSTDAMKLTGYIQTADNESPENVEKLINTNFAYPAQVSWQHNALTKTHNFTITPLKREKDKVNTLTVSWDGSSIGVDKKGNQDFVIPAIGDFQVMDIKAMQDQDQYVLIQFSDAIKVGQELNGLISLGGISDPAYTIEGSTVKVYAPNQLEGNYNVTVNEGIENISGQKIKKAYSGNVFFENRMPAVTIPGKGVILPDSGKLMMAFEAVNLNAVDVSIIKIYADNVPQYFQNNGFDGGDELRYVGRPVVQKTIRLDADKSLNLNKKNRFMLDMDNLIRTEPGAIYRVVIGFRKEYSLYNCSLGGPTVKKSDEDTYEDEGDGENSYTNSAKVSDEDDDFWARYDNYYPDDFNWSQKDDPCTNSYFTKDRWAARNIIASNIGLIAKAGRDNNMRIAVTNILTAKPMAGVELDLLDFQKQVLYKATSDADGFANFQLKRKPYLLVAKNGNERGYLRLDDGSSLPLSRFNVGGDEIQQGLKGFLYGERGVWRPGDSIFMSFILEDKLKTLPADHPVEFDLYDPNDKLYKRIVQTQSVDGFYSFHTATELGSPTGNWTAKVKVGKAEFDKNVKIETIMPNRLKIGLTFGGETELTKGNDQKGLLTAQWLFGGTAQNLKAKIDAFLSTRPTAFKGFEDYNFDNPTLSFTTQTANMFDGTLDAEGKATVNTDLSIDKEAPGQLSANFLIKVFEPGGNFSIQSMSMPYNVYPGYVGIKTPKGSDWSGMLYTGRNNEVDIADVDTKGKPFAGTRDVDLELYKIQWRWWWDESGNEFSNFTQDKYNKLVKTETIKVVNGRAQWNLNIPAADWGRYLLLIKDPQTGHSTGKILYMDWPNWAERLQETNPTEAAMLSFTSDKTNYKVGDEATLTIPTMSDGRALVSLENGSRILSTTWIDTKKGQTRYSFKVDGSMAPNVFVNITLLQRHSQTVNDLPIRMYGAIPLNVEDPATVLKPVIRMPDKIRPETPSSVTVSEASGKEMTYTIAIVDEGLLDITNYKTPDPHQTFYAREALGVKTWDLFDYVIGAYGTGLERILSIGGDGTAGVNHNVTANRFKPVVKFMGPYHLNAGEKQTHGFTLPQYIGSVKVMVIAGHEGSYGFADKYVSVKKPLMILATLPRVLAPTEKIQLPVTVFAMEPNIKNVDVKLQSNMFSNLAGNNEKTVAFSKTGDQLVTFNLDVKDFVGIGKVHIIARSGSETSAYDVEMNVRNPNPPITEVQAKELAPGESWTTDYKVLGTAGTAKTTLEVASIPPLNLSKRLDYLIEYPYGCVEQTTSSAFPQLFLDQLMDLTPRQKAETERNIKATINRLNGFQLTDGGLSYWPGVGDADDWGTNYAGHFMLAAQDKGYSLPIGFLEHWKNYQRQKAQTWTPDVHMFYESELTQAYRLYLLALARVPEIGAMNRLKESQYLTADIRWRLAAAYKLAGQPEVAAQLVAGQPTIIKPYYSLYGTYGSDLRDDAMVLETLTLLGRRQQAASQLHLVAQRLSEDDWYSTQTTAYSLISIAEFCGRNKTAAKLMFNYQAGAAKANVNSQSYLWQSTVSNGGHLSLKNNGSNRLYIRLIQKGQPSNGDEVKTNINPDVLDMHVDYLTLNGKPIDPSTLKQGTDFVAQVTIKNPGRHGYFYNMALTQIFPSGWEILNSRLTGTESAFNSSDYDYIDIRDDRVYTFFGAPEGKELKYNVMLNAAYAGKYYLPATVCEAMYNKSFSAIQKGQWVEVVK